jgi:hypothetical protein
LGFGVAGNKTQRREERGDSSSGDRLRTGLELTKRVLRFMVRGSGEAHSYAVRTRFDSPTDWREFSLSPGERAGVRGNGSAHFPPLPFWSLIQPCECRAVGKMFVTKLEPSSTIPL